MLIGFAAVASVLVGLTLTRRALIAYDPAPVVELRVGGAARLGSATESLELLSWNIGYAGLGAESDFIVDGGRRLRTHSRSNVERNLDAIVRRLVVEDADVVLLQELARDCYFTHGVDVLANLQRAIAGYQSTFAPTIQVLGLPFVGNLQVGQGTFSRRRISRATRHALPSRTVLPGITVQHFNAVVIRLADAPDGAGWVIFNVHLPAFDEGALRREQLVAVFQLLKMEYEAGHCVVAGGDWNLRLAKTSFAYEPSEKSTFWVRDLPDDVIAAGWQWVVDPDAPTNRTLEQPYREGVNYRSVIDGFLVSPNVDVLSVETLDLGFANSDHNPVRARVRRRTKAVNA